MHWLLLAVAVGEVAFALLLQRLPLAMIGMLAVALCTAVLAFSFRELTVKDQGDALSVRYGPLPVFGTRIRYADMTDVEAARSTIMDGWGIHYTLGHGWIYNLWGFDCVRIQLGRKAVRIGTNDRANLLAFLRSKLPATVEVEHGG